MSPSIYESLLLSSLLHSKGHKSCRFQCILIIPSGSKKSVMLKMFRKIHFMMPQVVHLSYRRLQLQVKQRKKKRSFTFGYSCFYVLRFKYSYLKICRVFPYMSFHTTLINKNKLSYYIPLSH